MALKLVENFRFILAKVAGDLGVPQNKFRAVHKLAHTLEPVRDPMLFVSINLFHLRRKNNISWSLLGAHAKIPLLLQIHAERAKHGGDVYPNCIPESITTSPHTLVVAVSRTSHDDV